MESRSEDKVVSGPMLSPFSAPSCDRTYRLLRTSCLNRTFDIHPADVAVVRQNPAVLKTSKWRRLQSAGLVRIVTRDSCQGEGPRGYAISTAQGLEGMLLSPSSGQPVVTVIVGFTGKGAVGGNGQYSSDLPYVMLAADSEQGGQFLKSSVRKLEVVSGPDWKALIGGAGDGNFIDLAVQEFHRRAIPQSSLDDLRVLLEEIVTDIHEERIKAYSLQGREFSLLCALWTKAEGVRLVVVDVGYSLTKDVPTAIGFGDELANYIVSTYHFPTVSLYQCGRLGVYLLSQVKAHVMYCGGESKVAWLLGDGSHGELFQDTITQHEKSNAAVMTSGARGLLYLVDPLGWNNDLRQVDVAVDAIATGLKSNIRDLYPAGPTLPPQASAISGSAAPPGPAATLSISQQPSGVVQSGSVFPQQPVIQINDAHGNPVAQGGVVVTVAGLSGPGATLHGTLSVTTNASGKATFTNLALSGEPGIRVLSFSSPGLSAVNSNNIAIA
jgi:hypothetical protein